MQPEPRRSTQPQHPPSTTTTWIATLDREPTAEEIVECMAWLDKDESTAVRRYQRREDAWGYIVSKLLPVLVMKSQRIRRPNWAYRTTKGGKTYIDVVGEGKMGVSVCSVARLSGVTFSIGKHKVVNTGIDAMRIRPPRGVSVPNFVESLMHKLAPLELTFLNPKDPEDVLLRRLCILLTLKEAYVKALGQPAGFDFSRIEFDFPNNRLKVDDAPIHGWEFKLFRVNLPVRVPIPAPNRSSSMSSVNGHVPGHASTMGSRQIQPQPQSTASSANGAGPSRVQPPSHASSSRSVQSSSHHASSSSHHPSSSSHHPSSSTSTIPPQAEYSDPPGYQIIDDWYQCVNAVFRGYDDRSTFFHCDKEGDLDGGWLYFYNIDNLVSMVRSPPPLPSKTSG